MMIYLPSKNGHYKEKLDSILFKTNTPLKFGKNHTQLYKNGCPILLGIINDSLIEKGIRFKTLSFKQWPRLPQSFTWYILLVHYEYYKILLDCKDEIIWNIVLHSISLCYIYNALCFHRYCQYYINVGVEEMKHSTKYIPFFL